MQLQNCIPIFQTYKKKTKFKVILITKLQSEIFLVYLHFYGGIHQTAFAKTAIAMKFRPLTKDEKNKVCLDFEMFRKNGTVVNSKINFLRSKTNSAASTPSSPIRNFSVAELNQIGLHVGSYATLSEKYRQFEEGQCAIAKWKNNRNWYNVVISRKINDFYFELLYEDGDIDKKVHISKNTA